MKSALWVAMAVWVAVGSSGCGTVCNLAGGVLHPDEEPRVYGGVQRDLEGNLQTLPFSPLSSPGEGCSANEGKGRAVVAVVVLALIPVEFGLNFVGDTLTLPLTIPLQEAREAAYKANEDAR